MFDVGANNGLFALYAAEKVGAKGRVLAFEPMPKVYRCALANVQAHAAWAKAKNGKAPGSIEVFNKACGDGTCDKLTLVSYDNLSVVNTIVPDHAETVSIMKSFLESQIAEGKPVGNALERALIALGARAYKSPLKPVVRAVVDVYARAMLASRHEIACEMTTVSDVMKARGVERLNLLKVDVERAELIVLEGVKDADWPKIDQVAVEIHDTDGRRAKIEQLLRKHGFKHISVENDKNLGESILMLHATR